MNTKIWFLISDEAKQAKLKALASKGWRPPEEDTLKPKYDTKIEGIEEIDRLMRQPPGYNKGGGRVRRR